MISEIAVAYAHRGHWSSDRLHNKQFPCLPKDGMAGMKTESQGMDVETNSILIVIGATKT